MPDLSVTCRLADTLLDHGLREFITSNRESGRSWDWLARELYISTERQVDVTGPTVRSWARQLDVKEVA